VWVEKNLGEKSRAKKTNIIGRVYTVHLEILSGCKESKFNLFYVFASGPFIVHDFTQR
jgi:hypothetical protein